MKIKILAFLFFCLSANLSSAQELIAEFEPALAKPRISHFLLAHDQDNNLGICYTFSSKFYYYKISPTGEVIDERIIKSDKNEVIPRGAILADDAFIFFYQDSYKNAISLKIPLNKEQKEEISSPRKFNKKEKYVGVLSTNDAFYQVHKLSPNFTSTYFIVYKYDKNSGGFESKKFLLKNTVSDKFRLKTPIQMVTSAKPLEPKTASTMRKIYLLGENKIVMTLDGFEAFNNKTKALLFDWESETVKQKIYGSIGDGASTNSYIKGESLYRIYLTRTMMEMTIHNLSDGEMLKQFRYLKDDPIDIMDSDVFTESNGFSIWDDGRPIEKGITKKVLKKLAKGVPFIYAENVDDEKMILTIGNFVYRNSNGAYIPGTAGSTLNTPRGPVTTGGTPGTWTYGNSYSSSRYFYAMIHPETNENISANATKEAFLSKQLQKFVRYQLQNQNSEFSFAAKNVFNMIISPESNEAHVVSFLRKEKKIKVRKIELKEEE